MLRVTDERQAAAKKTAARKRARDRVATRATLLAGDDPFRLHASFAPPGTPGDLDDEIRASLTRSVEALEDAGDPGIFPDIMADARVTVALRRLSRSPACSKTSRNAPRAGAAPRARASPSPARCRGGWRASSASRPRR